MTTRLIGGQKHWELSRDNEGHREYTITHLVEADTTDGPNEVRKTAGLPAIGAIWDFDSDYDGSASCTPHLKVTPVTTGEPNKYWIVENKFSTRPGRRCQDEEVEDPLLEPPKVSVTFVKHTEEKHKDYIGILMETSAGEPFSGPKAEWDVGRPQVRIVQNLADPQLSTVSAYMDNVNEEPMWGVLARCVKLSGCEIEEQYQGSCDPFYTRTLTFDVNSDTFDRVLIDAGTLAKGHWGGPHKDTWIDGDPQRYQDKKGNIARVKLDGNGKPLADGEDDVFISWWYYEEGDLITALGLPASVF